MTIVLTPKILLFIKTCEKYVESRCFVVFEDMTFDKIPMSSPCVGAKTVDFAPCSAILYLILILKTAFRHLTEGDASRKACGDLGLFQYKSPHFLRFYPKK